MFSQNHNAKNYYRKITTTYGHLVSLTFVQRLSVKKPFLQIAHQKYHVKEIMKEIHRRVTPIDVNVWPPPRIYFIIDTAVDDYIDNELP